MILSFSVTTTFEADKTRTDRMTPGLSDVRGSTVKSANTSLPGDRRFRNFFGTSGTSFPDCRTPSSRFVPTTQILHDGVPLQNVSLPCTVILGLMFVASLQKALGENAKTTISSMHLTKHVFIRAAYSIERTVR
jgi:hypothetical protein